MSAVDKLNAVKAHLETLIADNPSLIEEYIRQLSLVGSALNAVRGDNNSSANLLYQQVQNAPDLIKTITYTDTDTPDERITEIRVESAATDAAFIDTYSYAGNSGNYRLTAIARTQAILER